MNRGTAKSTTPRATEPHNTPEPPESVKIVHIPNQNRVIEGNYSQSRFFAHKYM